jgi:hypothetical protein
MEKKEVVEIIKNISTYYGGKFKMDDPQGVVNAWFDILKDYEFTEIVENLKNYVKNNHFPPSVADIIKVEPAKDRAIPGYEDTKAMMANWDQERANAANDEVAKKHLADMRKILGIKRG